MAKNLFEVVQSLFIPFVLLGLVCASTVRFDSEKLKRWLVKSLVVVAVAVLLVSFLREKRLIRYNQINNIRLLVASLVLGLGYAVSQWIYACRGKKILNQVQNDRKIVQNDKGGSRNDSPNSHNDSHSELVSESHNNGRVPVFALISSLVGLLFVACHLLYSVPVVFSLPFHFLGMYDTYFSTMYLAKCTGYLFGWLACFLSAWAVFKVLSRSSEKVGSLVFSALYLVSGFISFVAIIGIINSYYRRKIKIPTGLRTKLPELITAENVVFFVAIGVIVALAVAFFFYYTKIHGEYTNPAEHRKLKAFSRNNCRWAGFLLLLSAFVWVDMTAIKKIANQIAELSPSEEFQLNGNEIFIPLEQVSDGHLHRFTWTNDAGKGIRFIIVQKKGMNFGVGFDACDVCGDVGYYERKDEVVCNRCDVVMNKSTIGLKGGCNPVPLFSRIENGGIVILTDDLAKEAHRFKN